MTIFVEVRFVTEPEGKEKNSYYKACADNEEGILYALNVAFCFLGNRSSGLRSLRFLSFHKVITLIFRKNGY